MAQLKSTIVQGALTVTSNVVANKLIKIGGTSDQILMADGSTYSKSDLTALINTAVTIKGTLGTGGTITSLPTASVSTLGDGYKVTTAGTYNSVTAKVGDMFICYKNGSSYAWMHIPSGDDIEDTWREIKVNDTQILENGITTNALNLKAGNNMTLTNSDGTVTFEATDTGATAIETTGSGNAITSGSYDATTRKITLTKGNSFLPLSGGTLTGALGFNNRYLIKPVADFVGGSSSYTGAITITLPATIGNTMVSMWVDVYNYKTGTSFSAHVCGYTYQNSTWANNPSGVVYGADHKVRLGHNGTSFVIYIGELNSTWSYPQITVRNVLLGHSPTYANWYKNWTINFTSDSFKSVTATLTDKAWTTRNLNPSNYLTEEKDTLQTVTTRGSETTTDITANSFIKKDSSNDYILLGGGGTKAVSDFASADIGDDYLPLAGGTMTGAIVRNYSAASTDPVLKIGSRNQDVNIFKVYDYSTGQSVGQTAKSVYGYNLMYNGTGSGAANSLTLYCDNQSAATQVVGWQLNQAGQMGIGTSANTSYRLIVNGGANATTLYENGTSLANKYLGINDKAADSDKLDGKDSSEFALKTDIPSLDNYVTLNTAQTITGNKTFTGNVVISNNKFEIKANSNTDDSWIKLTNKSDSGYYAFGIRRPYDSYGLQLKIHPAEGGDSYYDIWHAGNQGAGSGLDADKLDGQEGSYYLNYNNFTNKPTIPAAQIQSDWNQTDTSKLDYIKNKPTIPTVNNATLTIQKNGTTVKTFTANSSTDVTANITVPTKTSELTNDSGFWTGTKYWANVAVSGSSSTATTPSVQKLGITGSTTATATAAVTMEYDSSYKALKFVFA